MNWDKWVLEKAKCCACGEPLKDRTKTLNLVAMPYLAEWKNPTWGNVLTGLPCIHAIAIVCDHCLANQGKIQWCIELDEERQYIAYHPKSKLKEVNVQ